MRAVTSARVVYCRRLIPDAATFRSSPPTAARYAIMRAGDFEAGGFFDSRFLRFIFRCRHYRRLIFLRDDGSTLIFAADMPLILFTIAAVVSMPPSSADVFLAQLLQYFHFLPSLQTHCRTPPRAAERVIGGYAP